MNKIIFGGFLSLTIFLQGCASLDDFRKMSPEQRATKVCDSDRKTRSLENDIRVQKHRENEAEIVLRRGYYIVEQCDYRYVKEPRRKYRQYLENEKPEKREKPKKEYICEKNIIPLTEAGAMQLEREAKEARARTRDLIAELDDHYALCHFDVKKMTAEEAFKRY